jgi:hypothetical protein
MNFTICSCDAFIELRGSGKIPLDLPLLHKKLEKLKGALLPDVETNTVRANFDGVVEVNGVPHLAYSKIAIHSDGKKK